MSLLSHKTKTKTAPRRRTPPSGSVLRVTTRASAPSQGVGLPTGALVVFGALTVLMLGWGLWLLFGWFGRVLFYENPRFTLERIEARTDGVLPESMLVEWTGISRGGNLFKISLEEVRQRLEKNPIIREAKVRRELPDRLVVVVNERVPIARLGQTEGRMNWLVDAEGVVINKSFQAKHLPFIKGVTETVFLGTNISNGRAGHALAYLSRLHDLPAVKRELLDVREISVGHPDFLDCRLGEGFRVLLPRNADVRDMLERASRTLYEIKIQNMNRRLIDLRPEGGNSIVSPE